MLAFTHDALTTAEMRSVSGSCIQSSECSIAPLNIARTHLFPNTPSCAWAGERLGIALIHIGKTGGTSVKEALENASIGFQPFHVMNALSSADCR